MARGDYDLELPSDPSFATRLAWAGERYSDLAEGTMPAHVGWFVWQMVVGWTDIGHTSDECRQLHALAGQIADLCRSLEEQ